MRQTKVYVYDTVESKVFLDCLIVESNITLRLKTNRGICTILICPGNYSHN